MNVMNQHRLNEVVAHLAEKDPHLKLAVSTYGPPPLWAREEGFSSLVLIILEQQVSLRSARAAYAKLEARLGVVAPEGFMTLSDAELKAAGFSRQKAAYCRNLAEAVMTGRLDFKRLAALDDRAAADQLMRIKGIGPWTAHIYLLMVLGRPDIWPDGDIALAEAVRKLTGAASRPSVEELRRISRTWKPWRSAAARILWHYYLSERKQPAEPGRRNGRP